MLRPSAPAAFALLLAECAWLPDCSVRDAPAPLTRPGDDRAARRMPAPAPSLLVGDALGRCGPPGASADGDGSAAAHAALPALQLRTSHSA
jgi:hypothetical protein